MELLAHRVRRVATPDDLQLPGDYCQTDHFETSGEICHSMMINCPFCRVTNAIKTAPPTLWQRIYTFFRKHELTVGSVIVCYGNPKLHRFAVRDGAIIPATL